jgi:hypothetical protein
MYAVFLDTAPGSPPQNVRARPVSSSTVVVQWEEPRSPNGIIRVTNCAIFPMFTYLVAAEFSFHFYCNNVLVIPAYERLWRQRHQTDRRSSFMIY